MRRMIFAVAWLAALAGSAVAEQGVASVYSQSEGSTVACPGHRMRDGALTAAHKTLPCGTHVLVRNKGNGRSVEVVITDRGPFVRGRVIDMTPAGARALGFSGLAPVEVIRR